MSDYTESTAVLSDCEKYRYLLRRVWDDRKIRVLFVMLNPSTADAIVDDPTIKSCVRICKTHDFGSLEVVNLFAYRATNPQELRELDDPVGPGTDRCIASAVGRCDLIICGWGNQPDISQRSDQVTTELLCKLRPAIFCVGLNKNGSPKHPLYVKSDASLFVYR